MVKIYLRYKQKSVFGVISSYPSNIIYDYDNKKAITGSLENIIIWDVRKGTPIHTLLDKSDTRRHSIVTKLCLCKDNIHLAAGYNDGTIKIWDLRKNTCKATFRGHKSAITALNFDSSGQILVSGSKDTDITLWDIISEVGMFKLKGHKNEITDCKFLEKNGKFIVSSSKDCLLKVWDMDTQHCIQTVVGHTTEIWSFDINPEQTRLITLSNHILRVYSIGEKLETSSDIKESEDDSKMDVEGFINDDSQSQLFFYGTIERKRKEKGSCIRFRDDGSIICIQSMGRFLEFLKVNSQEETKEKRKTRLRKEKLKLKKKAKEEGLDESSITVDTSPRPSDEFTFLNAIILSSKILSFAFSKKELLVSLQNNTIERYNLHSIISDQSEDIEKLSSIDIPGHRNDIRAVALSSNDELLLTASNNLLKGWNIRTGTCIRTLHSGFGLCIAFAPGDKYALLGTKEGKIEIYDLQSSRLLEIVDAHTAPVWGIQVKPDKSGLVSVGSDKRMKFWNFELVNIDNDNKLSPKRLTIKLHKAYDLPDDALSVKYSHDGKLIAVSLLDSTVRVYFTDTMKLFHTLYGHKLPVMTLDISDDNALLITGSADKDIKIWGLDFGDCHKSIFAHGDSVMQVAFVPQTHYFFSAGKDGVVKYWDADRFEHILTLDEHHNEIWALVVSKDGDFIVTGSQDRSIRVWERTEEQIIVDTERELELRKQWEETLEDDDERYGIENQNESDKATRKTIESIKSTERLMEGLEIVQVELENLEIYENTVKSLIERGKDPSKEPKPPVNPLLLGKTPREYLLYEIKSIRSSDLEESLRILPFDMILKLIEHLNYWIKHNQELELCTRCLFFIIGMHQVQISANKNVQLILHEIRDNVRKKIKEQKNIIGFNHAAMSIMKSKLESEKNDFFDEDVENYIIEKKQNKKRKLNYWE